MFFTLKILTASNQFKNIFYIQFQSYARFEDLFWNAEKATQFIYKWQNMPNNKIIPNWILNWG